jgi:hypothetical protein
LEGLVALEDAIRDDLIAAGFVDERQLEIQKPSWMMFKEPGFEVGSQRRSHCPAMPQDVHTDDAPICSAVAAANKRFVVITSLACHEIFLFHASHHVVHGMMDSIAAPLAAWQAINEELVAATTAMETSPSKRNEEVVEEIEK